MKLWSWALFLVTAFSCILPVPAHGAAGDGGSGSLMVTGHIYLPWREPRDIGVDREFVEKGIPLINGIHPDFVVFTGDLIYHPKEMVREQLEYVIEHVFNKIETKIYCNAGNHDTWWLPYPPAVELFEKLINPLRFSFEHQGSLFLFLSLYEPFPHVEGEGVTFPLRRVWDTFDTAASRSFLAGLRQELEGPYDHIFIFVHIPPISDHPIGYYWSWFIVPLLSSLKQDVFIFSTLQSVKNGLLPHQSVRYKNLRFYCWASYPQGSYIVHFDKDSVRVDLRQGDNFIPARMQEVDFQPSTRYSMLAAYLRLLRQRAERKWNYWLHSIKGDRAQERQMRKHDPTCARCKPYGS